MIFDLYKLGKEIATDANQLFGHSGKDDLGETVLRDSRNREWKVKLHRTSSRGRYIKISSYPDHKKRIRASADQYKSYLQITSDEWDIFYRAAAGIDVLSARAVLDRLVGI